MISQSRKVLLLLSKCYILNEWCREEFDHACRHVQQHNEKDLVIVLLHDRNNVEVMEQLTSSVQPTFYHNRDLDQGDVCVDGCVGDGRIALERTDSAGVNKGDGNDTGITALRVHDDHTIKTTDPMAANTNTAVKHGAQADDPDHDSPERRSQDVKQLRHNAAGLYRNREASKGSKKKRLSKLGAKEAKRLEDLCRFNDCDETVILEPLCSFLLEGRYLELSDKLFQHKLLFELSRERKHKRPAEENV
jgi:hypothetical protein